MEYFNLMESIVADTVDKVLAKNNLPENATFTSSDIIAYTLNRVPARYVTGERGVMHNRIDTRLKFQQHTDLLFLIYEAIEIFSKRRPGDTDKDYSEEGWKPGLVPHIIGEVLEESTLSIVPGIKVTLFYNESPAPMVDNNWSNPYVTSSATRGYYHFWPFIDNIIPADAIKAGFRLVFEHPDFKESSIDITVELNRKRKMGENYNIPLILLKLKDGISPEFLCRD